MNRQIPIYFDTIVASPIQPVSDVTPNLSRLSVGVFTKFGNRNGSYITEAVADMLIESATKGNTPVVGFFDPETQTWAGHTGPTLANSYGYVESFEGWQPFVDSDNVQRDYAVFSVVLFNDYYDEANLIQGQHQSMELNINSIDGDWADINGVEFFVYTKAAIQGLCIIGSHEPCFSASTFYKENNEAIEAQYEKFSSLLFELKEQVEEIAKNIKGGESKMDEFENQEQQVSDEVKETEQVIDEQASEFEEAAVENEVEDTPVVENEETVEESQEPTEYELLVQRFDALQADFNALQENYEQAQTRISELENAQVEFTAQIESLQSENAELKTSVADYEAQKLAADEDKKQNLIEQYEEILENAEEIGVIKENVKNYSYDELESKLAILFAHTQISNNATPKVPHVEPQESEFANFMKKYRKS